MAKTATVKTDTCSPPEGDNPSFKPTPDSIDEISSLVRAATPVIFVTTHEEDRFLEDLDVRIAQPLRRKVFVWSSYRGLVELQRMREDASASSAAELKDTKGLQKALEQIEGMPRPTPSSENPDRGFIFILRDAHYQLVQSIPRILRDISRRLSADNKTIILTAPSLCYGPGGMHVGMEPSLEKTVSVVEYALPDRQKIEQLLRDYINQAKTSLEALQAKEGKPSKSVRLDYSDEEYAALSRALQGLSSGEIHGAAGTCLSTSRALDPERLLLEKKRIINRSPFLDFIEARPSKEDIGGLDELKDYFSVYAGAFNEAAEKYGVEMPRGVILTGVPGTGKSLAAKAAGVIWGVPTLRLDMGRIMGGLVGQSESQIRAAISQAEAMAPCFVWLDEVEKAISGTQSSGRTDGGTMSRVFGTLLTAMQEGLKGVTLIATANDISLIPPEFIRRFDEVFFVDLPSKAEREEIFRIHLNKRNRKPEGFSLSKLSEGADGYTGAEIEKGIKRAIATAFAEGKADITTEGILHALSTVTPISKLMEDEVTKLRQWAKNRARKASRDGPRVTTLPPKPTAPGKGFLPNLDEIIQSAREIQKG